MFDLGTGAYVARFGCVSAAELAAGFEDGRGSDAEGGVTSDDEARGFPLSMYLLTYRLSYSEEYRQSTSTQSRK